MITPPTESTGSSEAGPRDSEPQSRRSRETIWLYGKSAREPLSTDFFTGEFRCRCNSNRCHITLVHPKLIDSLQTLRSLLARPLIVTSGFRCKTYNKIIGGRPRSYHTRGMAADILCLQPEHLDELVVAATDISAVGGIGRYPLRRFVHIDVRPREPFSAPATWSI